MDFFEQSTSYQYLFISKSVILKLLKACTLMKKMPKRDNESLVKSKPKNDFLQQQMVYRYSFSTCFLLPEYCIFSWVAKVKTNCIQFLSVPKIDLHESTKQQDFNSLKYVKKLLCFVLFFSVAYLCQLLYWSSTIQFFFCNIDSMNILLCIIPSMYLTKGGLSCILL